LKKYQSVTEEGVRAALRKHVLPLFTPESSVALVVTAPSRAAQIGEGLQAIGFKVEQRELHVDPSEIEDTSDSHSDSDESNDGSR